ncbi:beta-propeller domain-containing protein [Aestuariibacter sp. AA17]|uniref:Beta-propeller domain-containing protein n=1 Tax=Fluctibacter corallii TaxID=2984329 RepID=A0ABT3A7X5_9ALTE|nr:beta-propeller domain-containing protein [Aestuariibacter sp. AA17]MCV2884785.1 beta-propeller domain-containing protein [Aestuariibacter sp. AA17]
MNTNNVQFPKTKMSALVIAIGVMLSGCGGSGDGDVTATPQQPVQPDPQTKPPEVKAPKGFAGELVKAGEEKVSQYLKNGVYAATLGLGQPRFEITATPEAALGDAGSVSSTNTQEAGVDEADRIEYDGNFLYVATSSSWSEQGREPAKVKVMARKADYSLAEVSSLTLQNEQLEIEGLYLHKDRLAVMAASFPIYPLAAIGIEPWAPGKAAVSMGVFDVTTPSSSQDVMQMDIDGWLLGSRRIDNQLYVATSYVPAIDDIKPFPETDEEKIAAYEAIRSVSDDALMPTMTVNGVTSPMNAVSDCYIPANADEQDGYGQLLTITRINMSQPDDRESICLSIQASMLYMSAENVYLASDVEGSTAFHKIALNGLTYEASGMVKGQLGWRGAPNLRVDEEQGMLRVVSTDYQGDTPSHRLTVLQQNGTTLDDVAVLPNAQQPEAIGKPGEDVYAVRFMNDKAYIVTFEQIDPLYVIDLSVPDQPFVAGSLEIPGFSSYLHPMENGLLLGVGQEVEIPSSGNLATNGDPDDVSNDDDTTVTDDVVILPVRTGVKMSLFDVRDPQNPKELTSIVKENTYTPVEFDYKALTFTNTNGQYRFAIPLEAWHVPTENPDGRALSSDTDIARSSLFMNTRNSLLLLEVNSATKDPVLAEVDELVAPQSESGYYFGGSDRSVIHGDHVYYVRGPDVWHAMWQSDNKLDGPY